jgi:uncharacterized phage-like protein YoqJ
MRDNLTLLLQWLFLIGLLITGLITVFIIKNEKKTYREEAVSFHWQNFNLLIPNWWTCTEKSKDKLNFKRTDTRYEWYAQFQFIPSELKTSDEFIAKHLEDLNIFYDEDEVSIENEAAHLFLDKVICEKVFQFARVEGTATQNSLDRVYYDLVIFKLEEKSGFYLFESHASVLNGGVEGPYFEEALKLMSFD